MQRMRAAGYDNRQDGGGGRGEVGMGVGIREGLAEVLRDGSRGLPGMQSWERLGHALDRVISGEEEFRPLYEGFPKLMLRLFGFTEESWLEEACGVESKERDGFMKVFIPGGPLHRLVCATAPEYSFEFPVTNMPYAVQREITELGRQVRPDGANGGQPAGEGMRYTSGGRTSGSAAISRALPVVDVGGDLDRGIENQSQNPSSLAWFCVSRLSNNRTQITLSCYEYMLFCMVSSPLWRGRNRSSGMELRRRKRSSMLASRRAMYNKLYFEFLNFFIPKNGDGERGTGAKLAPYGQLFIALSLAFFCGVGETAHDPPTIGTLDALTVLMLQMQPKTPVEADLVLRNREELFSDRDFDSVFTDSQLTGAIAYSASKRLVTSEIRRYAFEAEAIWQTSSSSQANLLIALIRVVSLYMLPWSSRVRAFAEGRVLPRAPRRQGVAASALKHLPSALEQRISSLQDSRSIDRGKATTESDFRGWEDILSRMDLEFTYIFPRFVERAAKLGVGATDEGSKLLSCFSDGFRPALIAEAVANARANFFGPWYSSDAEMNLRELAKQMNSVVRQSVAGVTARPQSSESDLKGVATALGRTAPASSGAYGISRFQRGGKATGVAASSASERIRRKLEPENGPIEVMRYQVAVGQKKFSNRDVAFVGGAWEVPPYSYEFAPVLPLLRHLSESMSDQLRTDINLRFLASYHTLVLGSILFSFIYLFLSGSLA